MPAIWSTRREPAVRFLLAWLFPSWIVFELVATKLPHYVLPLYPAIAILLARVIEGKAVVEAALARARDNLVVHHSGCFQRRRGSPPRS